MEIKLETDSKKKTIQANRGLNQLLGAGRPSAERHIAAFFEQATGIDIRSITRLGRPISALMTRPTFGLDYQSTRVFGNFSEPRSETPSTTPIPAPPSPETPAPETAPAPAAPAAAIPFDLGSGVGLAVVERIESMIDARVEAKVSALRKEFAEVAASGRNTATVPPAPAAPATAAPVVEDPAPPAPAAEKPSARKKAASKPKDDTAAKEDAAKDEDK